MLGILRHPASFRAPARGLSNKLRRSTVAVLVVGAVCSTHPVGAEESARAPRPEPRADQPRPIDRVQTSVARVLAIVQSRPTGGALTALQLIEIRRVAEDLFDFEEMSRRTLAQHWNERSPQEQAELVKLFIDVLERSYLTMIGNYPMDAITFQGESVTGRYAQVRSRVVTGRRVEIPIEYRLLDTGSQWQVYDVVADGVSLVSSYRSQFSALIRTSSFAQLLEKLRNREAQAAPRQGP